MDLDTIIHDADPARELIINVPDPSHHPKRHWHLSELAAAAGVVAVCAAIAVLALQIHGSRGANGSATTPRVLPFSSATPPGVGPDVLRGTARVVKTFPDPDGGPDWGIRTYQTHSGMTCLQVGRTESGQLGAIGTDGAYNNDLEFHPFPLSRNAGLGDCEPNDAHGHAFINIAAVNTAMSAAQQKCLEHDDARPREHCPASALRDVYFGLLGPDATGITYVGAGGRSVTAPTQGADGAYLIVRPLAAGNCAQSAMRRIKRVSSCDYDTQGYSLRASVSSGEITAVTYRDGHVCHLPKPQGVTVADAQCPVVGYVAPAGPKYDPATIAAPVTVRKLPARYYCERPGIYRPADLAIPCDKTVPKGYRRFDFTVSKRGHPGTDPGQNLLIDIGWTAHGAVDKIDQSTYSIAIEYPKGCQSGGQGSGTQAIIRPGQRITRSFYVPTACRGTYTGEVTYTPNLGPNGENGVAAGPASPNMGVLLVGKFSFEVP